MKGEQERVMDGRSGEGRRGERVEGKGRPEEEDERGGWRGG